MVNRTGGSGRDRTSYECRTVSSIVRRGVLVRPTGTVPNQGSQLAVPVPVLLWRWLKEAGNMNSAA
jgi:hypothetical protein